MTTETKVCNKCGRELSIDNFRKTRWGGYANSCNECQASARAKGYRTARVKAKEMRISEFTPRELMEELARSGYTGKLKFTKIEEIDINNF